MGKGSRLLLGIGVLVEGGTLTPRVGSSGGFAEGRAGSTLTP